MQRGWVVKQHSLIGLRDIVPSGLGIIIYLRNNN